MNPETMAEILRQAMPYYAPFHFEFPNKGVNIYSYRMCDTLAYMAKDGLLEEEKAKEAKLEINKRLWPYSSLLEYLTETGKLRKDIEFASTNYDKKALQFWAYYIASITEAPFSIIQRLLLALHNQNLNLWNAEDILLVLEI
ncbi:hypothetical protein [Candidatus Macondimonas diazotrophica]|jgi:hypothetical protein|uniref:Uncharacterized protein n=1 Tax=Candidatus Macondimonas diazotrophica TaxID=2305248 RepID=A0A4Z0F889_9GAMM|nr:hypothetical protein [Candidatus Macondimonas diazotrophica]TFZ81684.1 hypothetical protein E4680_11480 [Candidatus Macondimonas diazotrophica]